MEQTLAYSLAVAGADRTVEKATPADAFARAREMFLAGQKLDMAALAQAVGVARGTLYRWTGDRDRLLGDVAWIEFSDLLGVLLARRSGSGARRLHRVTERFLGALSASTALQAFLAHEGADGLRLLTDPAGPVRPRLVEAIAAAVRDEAARGYRPPARPEVLADGIVCLGERFLYNGGVAALNPDLRVATEVIGLLLRE